MPPGRAAVSQSPLAVERARELVLEATVRTPPERVPLDRCLGRITAAAVISELAAPPFDNSAMDGYALRSADAAGEPGRLRIVAESRAGSPADRGPGPGEAVRISTGAMIPPGADAVLPLESAEERDGWVLPQRAVEAGENLRRAGEDFGRGERLLGPGHELSPAELGLLAAAGVTELECAARPTIAVLTSGDELVAPGEPLAPGQIYDASRQALPALAELAGALPRFAGVLPDERHAVRDALAAELDADVLVVAGGVSVGRHDHVKAALIEIGVEERFWRVALRPGGPTWFGVLPASAKRDRPTLVFGLPGNPVSAMVTFHLFVRPALRAMTGRPAAAERFGAILTEEYRKPAGRAHYLRCRIEHVDGTVRVRLTSSRQGSHVISSMIDADALAVIPAVSELVEAGTQVEVELLR